MARNIANIIFEGRENECLVNNVWVPARPMPYPLTFSRRSLRILWSRIKDAWGVIMGRYDAVSWDQRKGE